MTIPTWTLREPQHFQGLISYLEAHWYSAAKTGKPLTVEVKPEGAKRSTDANRYHWQMLGQISEQAWVSGRRYEPKVWHHYYCEKFLGVYELPNGKTCPIGSSGLSVEEFSDFDRKIEADAASELGVQFYSNEVFR